MRENMGLYRGKRKDNGEWIEGSLLKVTISGESCYLIFSDDFAFDGNGVTALSHALVDPETIGECSGLPDKNGKRIFEGDVLRIGGKSLPHWLDEGDIKAVEYNEGAFSPLCDYDSDCGMFVESSECEVIGNIYDNPELLEVSGDD